MTPAGKLQDYIRARVEARGGQYRKVQWTGRVGCPDCFVWFAGGRFAFIEVKVGKDRHSVLQAREGARMAAAGIPVHVVRTETEVDAALARILEGGRNP